MTGSVNFLPAGKAVVLIDSSRRGVTAAASEESGCEAKSLRQPPTPSIPVVGRARNENVVPEGTLPESRSTGVVRPG